MLNDKYKGGLMLSRVANDFYWIGRYVERVHCLSRFLLVQIDEMPEDSPEFVSASWQGLFRSLHLTKLDKNFLSDDNKKNKISDDFLLADAYTLVDYLTFETYHHESILSYLEFVRENARQNQATIPKLMWPPINKIYLRVKPLNLQDLWPSKIIDLYKEILEFTYLFYGLTQDSVYQNEVVHFIQIGRYLERFQNTVSLFESHIHFLMGHKKEESDLMGTLLRCGGFDNYRQVYSLDLKLPKVTEFLLRSDGFTGSLKFCNNKIKESLSAIEENKKSNSFIYKSLENIEQKLKQPNFEQQPLKEFLNSIYTESFNINKSLNEVYFNPKSFNALVTTDQ